MPASPITTAAALFIHSQVPMDSDVGIRYGMENSGLLVSSIGYKPSREKEVHTNHRKARAVVTYATPNLVLSVDAKVLQLSGRLAAKHPGDAIHTGYVQDFYEGIAHGFEFSATGYWLYEEPDTGSPQGTLNTCKFNLEWFDVPDTTVELVSGAVAPA